jgi:O-antigen/teichoic acid export membrane protein
MARLAKHSTIYVVGGALNRIGVFLLLPVYTSYLSVAQYGELELFYAVSSVASGFLSAGLAHATLRFYFEYESQEDRNAVVSTNLVLGTGIAAVGAMLLAWFRVPVSEFVFASPAAAYGIAVVATTMVLELSTQICLGFIRAREASIFFLTLVLAKLLVQVGVNTYVVIALDGGVHGVLTGNCIAVGLGWVLAAAFTVRHCGLRVDPSKAGPVLRYSLPFVGSTIVAIVAANLDRYVIRRMLSFEALGLFALAYKFSRLLEELIGEPFGRAYGSFRFSVMRQENAAAIQARVVRLLLAVLLFATLGVQLFAADVLYWVSDESFQGAAALMLPLLIAAVARVMSYPLQTGILVQRETRQLFWINLGDSVLYIGTSILLIYWFGILGACVAMAITSTAVMIATDRVAQRYFRVRYEWDRLARIVLITVGAFLVGSPLVGHHGVAALTAKAVVMVAFAAALVLSDAFDAEERATARNWLRGWLGAGAEPGLRSHGKEAA